MEREKSWSSDEVARTLSIRSIAGTTVARFGVPREKNNVASLKICPESCTSQLKIKALNTYPQNVLKLFGNTPFFGVQLIFP